MILYTCYFMRAVYLDLVSDIRTPARMILDNAKTLKSHYTTLLRALK